MITVFLVDGHEVIRRGLRRIFAEHDDIRVVGEAEGVAAARARLPTLAPTVVVLEARLPDGTGAELCADLVARVPGLHCVVFTAITDEQVMFDAVLAGARGFLIKDARGEEIVQAVRDAAVGRSLLDGRAAAALMARMVREESRPPDPLASVTLRERDVLAYVGQGLTNREIGARMFLAEKTVKNYVSELLTKFGMSSRIQLAVLAVEQHLDTPAA
ncbi:response regulator transcription factor [Actinomycetospora sp. TBRC 11914]|uniref:response regulator n=1 Tax=Actinomycetospora sp. TBRC 11914 TaxID=2729387 RepID=UPI00145D852C|nr:response regulator transcription factor [Actinomycetospora sp. TBRC 11914]NMO89471.1 response regulator transcription factor [Actinomycetospora sp. TBRC 11914]